MNTAWSPQIRYRAPFLLRNGHLNTIYPYFFRRNNTVSYSRERISTSDNDFIDLDWIKNNHDQLCILAHGLEGNSNSQYMYGTADALSSHGWDILCINYRGCSGENNLKKRSYHSGATDDLHTIITHVIHQYRSVALVGFSLGGNLVLKYLGEKLFNLSQKIRAAVAVSAPIDLEASSLHIGTRKNYFYQYNFLKTLKEKIKIKMAQYPGAIDYEFALRSKSLFDFDDRFTAPIHEFRDAFDYYDKCNSRQFLHQVNVPSLIINALDDPFLPDSCYPFDICERNSNLHLITPKHGGHVGFTTLNNNIYWEEMVILDFINYYSSS